ncbi:MAG: tetratricopeptide repeat protein [Acidobacteriota bacterium]|nr:tetratricopeptide repeat protein [Acidobacteriota bacterium]
MTRAVLLTLFLALPLAAQDKPKPPAPPPPPGAQEQEPPEEDPDLKPKEYSFNPLEASRNITAGNFYFKKGNYRAAARRFLEASKWDPTSAEALLLLGGADEKLRDFSGARESYEKFVAMATDAKEIESVKKKLATLPKGRTAKK